MRLTNSSKILHQVLALPASLMGERDRTIKLFKAIRETFPQAFLFETTQATGQELSPPPSHSATLAKATTQLQATSRLPIRTVIGLKPVKTLRRRLDSASDCEISELIQDGEVLRSSMTFYEALAALRSEILGDVPSEILRTTGVSSENVMHELAYLGGGIFGSIGYESVSEIERTVHAAKVSVEESDASLISAEVFTAHDLIVIDFEKNRIQTTSRLAAQALEKNLTSLELVPKLKVVSSKARQELSPKRLNATMGEMAFCEKVKILKNHIRAGNIFQAVLSERFDIPTRLSAFEIFENLAEINPAAYNFFFQFSNKEFAGTSPESLVQVHADVATTHPIAGTQPRGKDHQEDLRNAKRLFASRKENAEHLMLVDLARNDLGRVAKPGTVRVTKFRELHHFATVMHLVSEVQAQLPQDADPMAAFKSCFPAGTLTGAPKIRAMQILSELEISRRGTYGGAVIALDPSRNSLESCIAIRCFEKTGDVVTLRAGAGVVADSKPKMEYAEINHKLRALRQAIFAAENKMADQLPSKLAEKRAEGFSGKSGGPILGALK